MKLPRLFLMVALVAGILGFADGYRNGEGAAARAGPSPLDTVKVSVSRVLGTVQPPQAGSAGSVGQRAEIHRVAHALFDVNDMARRALGQHWHDLSPPEKDLFVRVFTDVLDRTFTTIVERYAGDHVVFLGEEVAGAYARVRSTVTPDQRASVSIEYRLFDSGSRWVVYDLVLGGVSLVATYRNEFNSIIRTSSFDQLLDRMRTARSPRPLAGDAGGRGEARGLEPDPSVRDRLAIGLLVSGALHGRRR
jgi:phospholipid transport system substrate-binding protein